MTRFECKNEELFALALCDLRVYTRAQLSSMSIWASFVLALCDFRVYSHSTVIHGHTSGARAPAETKWDILIERRSLEFCSLDQIFRLVVKLLKKYMEIFIFTYISLFVKIIKALELVWTRINYLLLFYKGSNNKTHCKGTLSIMIISVAAALRRFRLNKRLHDKAFSKPLDKVATVL